MPSIKIRVGASPDINDCEYGQFTLLDWYMAHAPAVPEWFLADVPPCRAVQSYLALTQEQREAVDRLDYGDEPFELRAWAEEFCTSVHEATQAQEAWQAEFRKQCLIQWPRAWAELMLKERVR